jgi:hypothetical protein
VRGPVSQLGIRHSGWDSKKHQTRYLRGRAEVKQSQAGKKNLGKLDNKV